MIRSLALASLLVFAAPALAEDLPPLGERTVKDAPVAADRWKTDIEAYLKNLGSLKARFIQIGADGSRAEGQIQLARPGRVRFDYGKSSPILVVADGHFVFFVDYSNKQVTRYPVSETPLRLLLDRDFRFGQGVEVVQWGQGNLANMASVTVRDPKHRKQGALTLHFVRQGTAISLLGWDLEDAQKSITQIVLADLQPNAALPESAWEFKDPRPKGAHRPSGH